MTKAVPWLIIYHQRFISKFFKVWKLMFGVNSTHYRFDSFQI
jgi:hypothetical protein